MTEPTPARFPLLESVLANRGLQPCAIYSLREAAKVFGVSSRTLQDWISGKKLRARKLPGHGRFLPQDLEEFLAASAKD
jgi:excisionase family DNA binding protein